MRTTIVSLGLGLLLAGPAFAAGHGAKHVVAHHSAVGKNVVAEGDKPADTKPAEDAKAPKKGAKKTGKKAAEKPAEAAPAK